MTQQLHTHSATSDPPLSKPFPYFPPFNLYLVPQMMTPKLETGFWYKFISLFWCRGKDLSWEGVIGHWCSRDQGGGEVGWQMALLLFTKLFSPPPTNWVLQTNISDKSAPAVRFSFGESQKTLIIIIHLRQMMIFIIFSSRSNDDRWSRLWW